MGFGSLQGDAAERAGQVVDGMGSGTSPVGVCVCGLRVNVSSVSLGASNSRLLVECGGQEVHPAKKAGGRDAQVWPI